MLTLFVNIDLLMLSFSPPPPLKKSDNFSGNYVLAYRGIYMTNINPVYFVKKEKVDLLRFLKPELFIDFENLEEIFFFDEENIN